MCLQNIFNQEQTPKFSKTQSKARMQNHGMVVFSFSLKIVLILWQVDQSNGYLIEIQSSDAVLKARQGRFKNVKGMSFRRKSRHMGHISCKPGVELFELFGKLQMSAVYC